MGFFKLMGPIDSFNFPLLELGSINVYRSTLNWEMQFHRLRCIFIQNIHFLGSRVQNIPKCAHWVFPLTSLKVDIVGRVTPSCPSWITTFSIIESSTPLGNCCSLAFGCCWFASLKFLFQMLHIWFVGPQSLPCEGNYPCPPLILDSSSW